MVKCPDCENLFAELDRYIDSVKDNTGVLINVLHKAQEIFGYLSEEVQQHVSEKLNVPLSQVYGVVTFYNFFTMKPKGKHQIRVCLGTACYVKGADKIMERLQDELGVPMNQPTADGKFSIHAVRCLGACSMAPVVLIGEDDYYGRVTPDEVSKILDKYRRAE
ncbi:MAG TPA: NAD(P)H-dependent oxidoreductase subunit E [Mesotoga infera]|nr:NAD(P)H-dependent oxidoreductase subunit E [Mesotoga infera]HOI63235.1 NAD(P)H-dependent oxidoreductase subunit E [Mesotoga sp.]HNS67222.1 NAD(P)H-dependent oxidoreductase subunit E [Mesotoga infera]HOI34343.1 NAD(P)H-dependent oxidoreductase subunit E [Mesotoga infera]HON27213.1 NAD(P)H-dependent oxidoreductase subunit E [Mesotoga infera]HPD37473.1 NAD(P)H-dependent oxidoreductase subunit E [Mesotoga infera]